MQPIVTINLDSVAENWKRVKRLVGPKVQVAAVLKCNAYGLGLLPVAETLHAAGCEWFFVSDLSEAETLRRLIRGVRIVTLTDDFVRSADRYVDLGVTPTLASVDQYSFWLNNYPSYFAFAYLDTGLSRGGIPFDFLVQAPLHEGDYELGLMSHLACLADQTSPLNRIQKARFDEGVARLKPKVTSLSASAGVYLGSEYYYDMIRVGELLFGISPAMHLPRLVRTVIAVSGLIVNLMNVEGGASIGYGAKFTAPRDMKVAIVRIGYMHGFPLATRKATWARLRDHLVPIVGAVSMEHLAIDITDVAIIEHVMVGDQVFVVDEVLLPEALADAAETEGTDILLRFGSLARREYYTLERYGMPIKAG